MNIPVESVKNIVYPVRFSPESFEDIKKIAAKNKTTPSKVIRFMVEEALKNSQ